MATRDITLRNGPGVERALNTIISACGGTVGYCVKSRGRGTITFTLTGKSADIDAVEAMRTRTRLS